MWFVRKVSGSPLSVAFRGELRPEQAIAARAILGHDNGILSATTAFGNRRRRMADRQRRVNTADPGASAPVARQWIERLSAFLDSPRDAIGYIGGGRRNQRHH